jgi:hypothetical protein
MVDGNKIIIIFYFIYCVCANYKCCIMLSRGPDLENKVSCILPLVMIYKNKLVTLKNWILKYIGMTNINILKRKCHVGINVVFLEVILKLCDVCFMKNIFIAPMNMFAPTMQTFMIDKWDIHKKEKGHSLRFLYF